MRLQKVNNKLRNDAFMKIYHSEIAKNKFLIKDFFENLHDIEKLVLISYTLILCLVNFLCVIFIGC